MEHRNFALAGLMGWPVAHSRSPDIHNHWMAEHGLRGAYVLLPVAPDTLGQALRALPVLGFAGCNLTIPHKVAAMALVDRVDPVARRIGAINTVVVQPDGSLAGFNNDGFGYIESLRDEVPGWRADAVYTCQPGTNHWGREFKLASLRCAELMPEPMQLVGLHAALGDCGAAAPGLQLAFAALRARESAAASRALVYGESDDGGLGACMIETASREAAKP